MPEKFIDAMHKLSKCCQDFCNDGTAENKKKGIIALYEYDKAWDLYAKEQKKYLKTYDK